VRADIPIRIRRRMVTIQKEVPAIPAITTIPAKGR